MGEQGKNTGKNKGEQGKKKEKTGEKKARTREKLGEQFKTRDTKGRSITCLSDE